MEYKDILSIYLADNALVNQKTTYYFAANALLIVPVANNHVSDPKTSAVLCSLGAVFSVISLASIARTAAFRSKWRKLLIAKDIEFEHAFSDKSLAMWARVPSNPILMAPPIIGLCMWLWAASQLI